jgi:hypothetical protein
LGGDGSSGIASEEEFEKAEGRTAGPSTAVGMTRGEGAKVGIVGGWEEKADAIIVRYNTYLDKTGEDR